MFRNWNSTWNFLHWKFSWNNLPPFLIFINILCTSPKTQSKALKTSLAMKLLGRKRLRREKEKTISRMRKLESLEMTLGDIFFQSLHLIPPSGSLNCKSIFNFQHNHEREKSFKLFFFASSFALSSEEFPQWPCAHSNFIFW